MGKVVKKKKQSSVKKKPITLSYSKTVIITMGVLLLTLFLFVFETQQFQQQRSHAALTNCDVPANELEMSVTENQLLQLINQYRAGKGAPALKTTPSLIQSAAWLSIDMNSKSYLAHTDSLGRDLQTRITQCGYPAANGVGENIARGTGNTAQEIFDLWRTSTEGHNEEMLDPNHKVVGIAQSGMIWTADFGNSDELTGGVTVPSGTVPSSAVTPSFFPLAPCPSCANPSAAPTTGATTPIATTAPVQTTPVIAPTAGAEDPCDASVAQDNSKPKHKKKGSSGDGFFEQILNFFLELIKKLLELLGGSPSAPSTPGEPEEPAISETPNQPCDPNNPPEPDSNPSEPPDAPDSSY